MTSISKNLVIKMEKRDISISRDLIKSIGFLWGRPKAINIIYINWVDSIMYDEVFFIEECKKIKTVRIINLRLKIIGA